MSYSGRSKTRSFVQVSVNRSAINVTLTGGSRGSHSRRMKFDLGASSSSARIAWGERVEV